LSPMARRPGAPSPFPYTTLFRSAAADEPGVESVVGAGEGEGIGRLERSALMIEQGAQVLRKCFEAVRGGQRCDGIDFEHRAHGEDRKSTRLNSSHVSISYAVFCL